MPATEWGPLELLRARRLIEGEIAAPFVDLTGTPVSLGGTLVRAAEMANRTFAGTLPAMIGMPNAEK